MARAKQNAILSLFECKSGEVRETYETLIEKLTCKVGPFGVEVKKTSLHLTKGSAFAGVHPKKGWLDLTIRLSESLTGTRIRSAEQVSRNRWHNEIRLVAPKEVDSELLSWLAQAHALSGGGFVPSAKRNSP
nr:DUF5655 domain-containing protein [Nitrosomonas nitrosa]